MYDKLNLLAGATAPNYSPGGNFMRGTLSRITIGDLLYRQTGFISNLSLTWNNSYQWEINDREIEGVQGLPHILDVGVQFTPIHNFNVKSDLDLMKEKFFGKRQLDKTKPTEIVNEPVSSVIDNQDGTTTFSVTRTNKEIELSRRQLLRVNNRLKKLDTQPHSLSPAVEADLRAVLETQRYRLQLAIPQFD